MTGHPPAHWLADLFWVWLPRSVLRLSGLGGAAFADGSYLRAWRPAAAAPIAAMLLGLALGVGHPGEFYTYSLTVMGVLGAVSALGAGVGCWALAGFAVGDLPFGRDKFSHLVLPRFEPWQHCSCPTYSWPGYSSSRRSSPTSCALP